MKNRHAYCEMWQVLPLSHLPLPPNSVVFFKTSILQNTFVVFVSPINQFYASFVQIRFSVLQLKLRSLPVFTIHICFCFCLIQGGIGQNLLTNLHLIHYLTTLRHHHLLFWYVTPLKYTLFIIIIAHPFSR